MVIFYILILILFLLLAGSGFLFTPSANSGVNRLLYIPLIVFSCYILVFFIINLVSLFRNNVSGGVGKIKKRMVGNFVLIVFLSTVPQSILSYRLTNASLDYWLDQELTEVLLSSLDFNLGYYEEQLDNLERMARNNRFSEGDLSSARAALPLWEEITRYNSKIDTLQVLKPDGSSWLLGDELARVPGNLDLGPNEGFLSRRDLEEYSVLSYQFWVVNHDIIYRMILSSMYPRSHNQLGRDLSKMLEKQRNFQEYRERGPWFILRGVLFFVLPLLILSINIGFTLSQRIVDPLSRLEKAMDRVTAGDYSYRLTGGYSEELSHIVGTFNQMINELELFRAKVEQTGRVGAWKDLAQQLAHEIRNPLTPIKLSAQRILKRVSPEMDRENLILPAMERILQEANSLDYLLKEFRDFAGQKAPVYERLELFEFAGIIKERYSVSFPELHIQLSGEGPVYIEADKAQLTQVFSNLLDNAAHAMKGRGSILLGIYHLPRGNQDYARIVIQDNGPGIPDDLRAKIFQPYYTTRKDGTGLGLAIVERIINDHRGRIWLVSTGEGTTFTMDLPARGEDETNSDH